MRLPPATIVAAGLAVGLVIATAPEAVSAAPVDPALQGRIEAQLARYPGGVQIGRNKVSYDAGTAVMNFVDGGQTLATACPNERVCLYNGVSYAGDRLDLNTCAWYDLAWRGWQDKMRSVRYTKSSGTAAFENHGAVPDHGSDVLLFSIGYRNRDASSLGVNDRKADHVRPRC